MKNIWKNYNGLFILAAMIGGFFIVLTMGYAANDAKAPDSEKTITAPSATVEVKKLENQSKAWFQNLGSGYMKQLQQIAAQRRVLEESLKEQQILEAQMKARIQQLESLYQQMQKEGLWIVDSKLAEGK